MARNIFKPLYQDYSAEGLLVAIPFRLGWIVLGSIMMLAVTIILIVVFLMYFILPVFPVFTLIYYLFNK